MSYIRTYNNLVFDYKNIDPLEISILDIAKALSHIPRWLGHTKTFYSVAQHCCWCYDNTKGDKLEALMHDAPEAYTGDCPTPLKQMLPDFMAIEDKISKVIADKYGFQYPYTEQTKDVDKRALLLERTFIKKLDVNWKPLKAPITDNGLDYWTPSRAEKEFLKRFTEIKKLKEDESTVTVNNS